MTSTPLKVWWHELNTWEPEQARHFYNETLGWDFQPTTLPDGTTPSLGNAVPRTVRVNAPDGRIEVTVGMGPNGTNAITIAGFAERSSAVSAATGACASKEFRASIRKA